MQQEHSEDLIWVRKWFTSSFTEKLSQLFQTA